MAVAKWVQPECTYVINGQDSITTDGSVKHKVSGTMMAGILGVSPWSSKFTVSADLLGLGRADISDNPAVNVGKELESVIIEYAGKRWSEYGAFIPASTIYPERKGDHNEWEPDFQDDVFTGHVDGIVMEPDGTEAILEIKTSRNLESWANGVPEYYFWQVALYNHFITKQNHAWVVVGLVDEEAYKDTKNWKPSDDNTFIFRMDIDEEMVSEAINDIREWYEETICNNVTAKIDLNRKSDSELYTHLATISSSTAEIQKLVEEYGKLKDEIDLYDAEIKSKRDLLDKTKTRLRDYMDAHNSTAIISDTGTYSVNLTSYSRTKLDEKKMEKDGIDLAKYKVETVEKRFTIKTLIKKMKQE